MTDEDRELGIQAVKAFPELFKDAWKHDWKMRKNYCCGIQCSKCDVVASTQNQEYEKGVCTIPDPMPINWDNAMMLFREADRKQRCFAMLQITETRRPETFKNLMTIYPDISADKNPLLVAFSSGYFNHDATPADYIEAACITKEKSNEIL